MAPEQGWTCRQVRRVARNSMIVHAISLSLAGLLIYMSSGYLTCFFRGPQKLSDAEIAALITSDGHRALIGYIELNDRVLLPTDWQEISTTDGRPYSTFPFFLMPVGNQFVLVKANTPADAQKLVGPLGSLGEREQLVVDATVREHPEYQGRVLPAVLNSVAAFEVWGYVLLVFLIPWLTYSVIRLAAAIQGRLDWTAHAVARRFASSQSTPGAPLDIDREMESTTKLAVGASILTDSWYVRPQVLDVKALPLADVVWIYQFRQGSANFAVFARRNGKLFLVPLRNAQIPLVIEAVAQRIPWAYVGFDQDLAAEWRRDPQSIVARVDAAKSEQLGS